MTTLIAYYLGGSGLVALIIKAIQMISEKMKKTTLTEKHVLFGSVKYSYLNIVALIISIGISVFYTVTANYGLVYGLIGTIILYCNQYGFSKTLITAIVDIIYSIKNKTFSITKVSTLIDEIDAEKSDTTDATSKVTTGTTEGTQTEDE